MPTDSYNAQFKRISRFNTPSNTPNVPVVKNYNFEGNWEGTPNVAYTAADGTTIIEEQIVTLVIKNIYPGGYYCLFTQIYPPPSSSVITDNQFATVVTQSSENKYLLSGLSDGGLNTFYFTTNNDDDNLHHSFGLSDGDGFLSGVQTYKRTE